MGYSPWGRKESDTTEQLRTDTHTHTHTHTQHTLSPGPHQNGSQDGKNTDIAKLILGFLGI